LSADSTPERGYKVTGDHIENGHRQNGSGGSIPPLPIKKYLRRNQLTTYKFEINFFMSGGFLPLEGSVQASDKTSATVKARALIEKYITARGIIARCGTLSVKRVAKASAKKALAQSVKTQVVRAARAA
jgi:hypothetical protein